MHDGLQYFDTIFIIEMILRKFHEYHEAANNFGQSVLFLRQLSQKYIIFASDSSSVKLLVSEI